MNMILHNNISTTPSRSGDMARRLNNDEWKRSAPLSPKLGIESAGRTFLTLGLFLAGTGSRSLAPPSPMTGHAPAITWATEIAKAPKGYQALAAAEQVQAIRSLLGLNISELAEAMSVQRPTIYSWQSGMAHPHPGNAKRLRKLYELALRWRGLCAEPVGDWVQTPLDDRGTTLALLLTAGALDETAVEAAFRSLKPKIEAASSEFAGVRDRARRRGYKERTEAQKASSLDRETIV